MAYATAMEVSDAQRKEHVAAVRKRAEGAPVHVEVHALFEAPGLLPGLAKAEGQYADIALIPGVGGWQSDGLRRHITEALRSEEHTSELQSLMRISYAVFCLNKKTKPK